jgi:hypothetical protein
MLTGAYQNLTDECAGEFMESYDWAGLIAMTAILVVHLIEFAVKQAYTSARAKQPSHTFKNAGGDKDAKTISAIERGHVGCNHQHPGLASTAETDMKKVTVAILEIGIAAHSIIIGMSILSFNIQ